MARKFDTQSQHATVERGDENGSLVRLELAGLNVRESGHR